MKEDLQKQQNRNSNIVEVPRTLKVEAIQKELEAVKCVQLSTKEDLCNILDLKAGKPFDREIADQIYQKMTQDGSVKANPDTFIQTLVDAEEILLSKLQYVRQSLQKEYKSRREFSSKLEEARAQEVINAYGIMENAYLQVVAVEGKNLGTASHPSEPYLEMKFGDCEKFSTGVKTGTESLLVTAYDFNSITQYNLIGQFTVSLNSLSSQNSITQEFELQKQDNSNPNPTIGSVILQLQFVFSRVQFLQDIIKSKNIEIEQLENEQVEYESDLENLYEPFPGLLALYSNPVVLNKSIRYSNPDQIYSSIHNNNNYILFNQDMINQKVLQSNEHSQQSAIAGFSRTLTYSLFVVSLLLFFFRSPFLDLLVVFCAMYLLRYSEEQMSSWYYSQQKMHQSQTSLGAEQQQFQEGCTNAITILIVNVILEVIWLFLINQHWVYSNKDMIDQMSDSNWRLIGFILSIASLVIKVLLLAVFWLQQQNSLKASSSPGAVVVKSNYNSAQSLYDNNALNRSQKNLFRQNQEP